MQTVSYKELRDRWCDENGLVPADLLSEGAGKFNRAFNRLIRFAWDWHRWPILQLLEERRYRAIWSAQSYEIDAEVYHEATDAYYLCIATASASDVPGVATTKWEEITELEPFVAYEQDGETGFSYIIDVWNANPRTSRTARRLLWEYDERGIRFTHGNVPETVWVLLYQLCPTFRGDTWSESQAYSAGRVLYFESTTQDYDGDYWLVLDSTSAAESPITHPAKFARLEIPQIFADFIVAGASVAQLKGDGQLEKAIAEGRGPLLDLLAEQRLKYLSGGAPPRRARMANI